NGFNFAGPFGSGLKGLMIVGFSGDAVSTQAPSMMISDNYIGTDGTNDLGNTGNGLAVLVGADSVVVTNNLISGNGAYGIQLQATGANVQGNKIGTNAAGTAAVANLTGVFIYGGSTNIIGTDGDLVNDAAE